MVTTLNRKVVSKGELIELVNQWKRQHETIAFTNGVFDLELHPGHIYSLERAAELADRLIVGVNSDASARQLGKGPGRPRLPERTRAANIAALDMVDAVVIFGESTPRELLAELRPDFLVKGDEYRPEEVAGREYAGELVLIPRLEGFSTTNLDEERRADCGS